MYRALVFLGAVLATSSLVIASPLSSGVCRPGAVTMCLWMHCPFGFATDNNGCPICKCVVGPGGPATNPGFPVGPGIIPGLPTTVGKRDLSALNMEYSQLKEYCAENREKCLQIKKQVQGVCALQPGKCDELIAILSGEETRDNSGNGKLSTLPIWPGGGGACPTALCMSCPFGYVIDSNGCKTCKCNSMSSLFPVGKRDLSALNMEYSQLKEYCAENREKCLKIKKQVQGVCALQPGKCDELMAILSGEETRALCPPGPVAMCLMMFCPFGFATDNNGCQICKCAAGPGGPATNPGFPVGPGIIPGLPTTVGKRDLSALNMEYSQLKEYCAENREKCLKIKKQVQGVCALQPGKCDELMAILSGEETRAGEERNWHCLYNFQQEGCHLEMCKPFLHLMNCPEESRASEEKVPLWYCLSSPEAETCQAYCMDDKPCQLCHLWCKPQEPAEGRNWYCVHDLESESCKQTCAQFDEKPWWCLLG